MPKMTHEQLLSLFKKSLKNREKPINIWLEGFLNKKIVSYLLKQLNLNGKSTKIFLEKNTLSKLIETIKSFEFIIDGDRGFSNAEVATGGVDTKEINHKSMESKLYKGLYIIGELLDIDGDRGGFNLHFAWVSGIRAGESI
jgi:predicted Rossmann fold flavoprotein